MKEMAKQYSPKEMEDRIYKKWNDKKYFDTQIDKNKSPFSIMMPPPNITGQLHMGHALDDTIQDIFTRYNRMNGKCTLWLPGTDHASIATEVKVIKKLESEGLSKDIIGREKFLEETWKWKELYGGKIVSQVKKLGASCDWSREHFTLDKGLSEAVENVFITLYEKGLIYRGVRIVNWCPDCKTSISETEVEYKEEQGSLWHIKYLVDGTKDEYLTVATTRPETMLGDTAVAVHPDDERYTKYIGKNVILPILNKKIPVIADTYVEKDFGTGVVKITPAHDPNDFAVGERHNLPIINVMNENATMNELAGEYANLDRYEARKQIVKRLEEEQSLVKIEKHIHNVGTCYRCHTTIEPYASKQWFVKMETLAKPAIKAVKDGEIKFIPERFDKTYFHWMENIKDWCISRQLWWGHRIPAFYCQCGETLVAKGEKHKCTKCGKEMIQDPDVLDTWFSSALWPFSTLGWPNKTEDYNYFYPTSMLVTGYDIITFWVSKMIFSALEFTGKVPFKYVYVHGLVRDSEGRKMSKSLGNGVDPLDVIEKYGTDALRFSLIQNISPGNDIRYIPEKVESSRNFANKLWNAARFAQSYIGKQTNEDLEKVDQTKFAIEDKWILDKTSELINEVTENIDAFEIGIALQKIYDFVWNDICDTYIEMIKTRLYDENSETYMQAVWTLNKILCISLKLLHPYMPFITEEIYLSLLHNDETIVNAKWPKAEFTYKEEANCTEECIDLIKEIRNHRSEMNIPMSKKISCIVYSEKNQKNIILAEHFIKKMTGIENVDYVDNSSEISKDFTAIHMQTFEMYVDFSEAIDKAAEIEKLTKEKETAIKELKRAEGMLSNEKFVSKAPEKLINSEKEKVEKYKQLIQKIEERIEKMN
ncbi:MAG: valine--tRNA ligase [Clostridia bacterium]